MMRINASYNGRCCKCGTAYSIGQKIGYDGTAARGKKAHCLNCAGSALFVPDATQAEIAKLKQQLDEEHGEESTPVAAPVAKPVSMSATVDPLAAAIANAIEPLIRGKLDESRVVELIEKHTTPKAHTITVKTPELPEGVDMGRQHKQFEDLLAMISARQYNGTRLNIWVTGVAGTGKTTAAVNIAKALDKPYAILPTQTDAYGFYGFNSPGTGKYQRTPPREIWEHGGVLVMDDFDGTPAEVAIQLNAPFANGATTFPDGCVARHPDTVIIVTANTWGTGATNDYVGTTKQNAAFLDRFAFLNWEIDEALELDTCPIRQWAERVQEIRRNVQRLGLKILVTPRASYYGAALLQAGYSQAKTELAVLRKGMTDEHWRSVCATN